MLAGDSMVAMYWVLKAAEAGTYVFTANRIRNIRGHIHLGSELYHVIRKENTADIGSR